MVGISGKLHMRIADLRGLSGTWAPRADMGTACTVPPSHTQIHCRRWDRQTKNPDSSHDKKVSENIVATVYFLTTLFFFTAKNYDKETGRCDPYSGGKSSQKKMTSSGPRCCFAQAQTSSYEMLKDKRKWRLKN